MIEIKNKEKCVGCGSCESVCPQKCIHMDTDEEGFLYPVVDVKKCVGCNLCNKVCLINNFHKDRKEHKLAFAGKNIDIHRRMNSSSGGAFWELARSVLEQEGLVYGVAFDDEFFVQHRCVTSVNELDTICGSKYLPSKAGNVFNEIKEQVSKNRLVLFSGTPCQVSALYSFLGKRYSNLITIAVACHGIPSVNVWNKYKTYLRDKFNSEMLSYRFRCKKTGWHNYSVEARFDNGEIYQSKFSEDPYMKLFVRNISLRPSCYKCSFRGKNAEADIILCDFWSIKDFITEFDDNKGISLIIVHTETGKKLLESIFNKMKLHNIEYNHAMCSNLALVKSPMLTHNRKRFFDNYINIDFEKAVEKYTKPPVWKKIIIVVANVYFNVKHILKHQK